MSWQPFDLAAVRPDPIAELQDARARLARTERERDLYKSALARIADAESGIWGRIAHEALRRAREEILP